MTFKNIYVRYNFLKYKMKVISNFSVYTYLMSGEQDMSKEQIQNTKRNEITYIMNDSKRKYYIY